MTAHRKFTLERRTDHTGISGTGVVAEGVQFTDGTCVVRWLPNATARADKGVIPTTAIHDDYHSVLALHGHGASTYIQWENGDRSWQAPEDEEA